MLMSRISEERSQRQKFIGLGNLRVGQISVWGSFGNMVKIKLYLRIGGLRVDILYAFIFLGKNFLEYIVEAG